METCSEDWQKNTNGMMVCSEHFLKEDFFPGMSNYLTNNFNTVKCYTYL